jgi:AmmeMemoRadiSam system protein B
VYLVSSEKTFHLTYTPYPKRKNYSGGRRFKYTPQPTEANGAINEIYKFIEYLDRKGMYLIEMQRPGAFSDYLREYSNTICGRHPISVWLHSVRESVLAHDVRFVKYAQSEKARSIRDHSVSYAGAVCRVEVDL